MTLLISCSKKKYIRNAICCVFCKVKKKVTLVDFNKKEETVAMVRGYFKNNK